MELFRIGNKLISRDRIIRRIDEVLRLRAAGKSQQATADAARVDRTFVSRIETLGEVRKGGRTALVGFPIKNKDELERAAVSEGVEYSLVLTEADRLAFAASSPGANLVNAIMEIVARLRSFDTVVFLGSDQRVEMAEALLGRDAVYGIVLGKSPLKEDVYADVGKVVELLREIRG